MAGPLSTGPSSGEPRWGSAGHIETASDAVPHPAAAVSAPTRPSPNRGWMEEERGGGGGRVGDVTGEKKRRK